MSLDLDRIQAMICDQAVKKGWKTDALYCIKRIKEKKGELEELENAVINKETEDAIAKEIIDNIYFLVQVGKDKAPHVSLTKAFMEKYEDNWVQKKKTEDEKGNPVRR